MNNPTLAEYCKLYELNEDSKLLPGSFVFIRLDGRSFHSFTSKLQKPFDDNLTETMRKVTQALVKEWNMDFGYVQSDEISLVSYIDSEQELDGLFFKGRKSKWLSVIASSCTAYFSDFSFEWRKQYNLNSPNFDCRVWQAPEPYLYKYLIWREDDALRNSVSMLARAHFSHKSLYKKSGRDMQEMLLEKGIKWHELENKYRRGSFYAKRLIERKFTGEEIEKLPENHDARKNPDLVYLRSEVVEINPPRIRSINPTDIYAYLLNQCNS